MKSSKKRSRAVVTVVACILAVCLVAALVLFSLVNSKVRALQKGATFEFSYNITAQDSASTPALYNILKQVGATSGDVAGLYSPGQLQLYLYPSGGLARTETGGTDFFTDLYIDANDTYFDAGRLYRTLRDSIADSAPLVVRSCRSGLCPTTSHRSSWQRSSACPTHRWPCRRCPAIP